MYALTMNLYSIHKTGTRADITLVVQRNVKSSTATPKFSCRKFSSAELGLGFKFRFASNYAISDIEMITKYEGVGEKAGSLAPFICMWVRLFRVRVS